MAAGDYTDFKIYQPEFYGGMFEAVDQFTGAFNAASQNAIRLVARQLKGHFESESFLKDIASLITYRDISSIAGATDEPMTQDEFVSVKVNRKIGPVAQTLDSWRKIGANPQEMSFQLGTAVGERKIKDYLNTALIAGDAALDAVSVNTYGTGTATLSHSILVSGLAKMGDQASDVVAWVMHSKPFFDLMQQTITDNVFGVAGITVVQGTVASLGRPIIVTDSPALHDLGTNSSAGCPGDDKYHVLGLVSGAITVTESEQQEITSFLVTGLENLVMRVQGEYAFNVGVRGMAWDKAGAQENPDNAALGTSGNWKQSATSTKHCAGVKMIVQ